MENARNNQLSTIKFKIVDRTRGNKNHIMVESRCSDLPEGLSLHPNVRDDDFGMDKIAKEILHTINESPILFFGSNNGIKISCRNFKIFAEEDDEFIELYLDDFDGLFNGGHTYKSLINSKFRSKIENIHHLSIATIAIDIVAGYSEQDVYTMAVGSNTQIKVNAVQTWAMIKGKEVSDWMRDNFINGQSITAKQKNKSGNKTENMVKLLANWLPNNFTTNSTTHEITGITGIPKYGVAKVSVGNLGEKLANSKNILKENTSFYNQLIEMTTLFDVTMAHNSKFVKSKRYIIGSYEKLPAISVAEIIALTFVFSPLVHSKGNNSIEWVDNAKEIIINHKTELAESIDDYLEDINFGQKYGNNNGTEVNKIDFNRLNEIGKSVFLTNNDSYLCNISMKNDLAKTSANNSSMSSTMIEM